MLSWIDGETRVDSIRKTGAAAAAGIKAGDVLVQINGKDALEYDPFTLRQLLTSEGGTKVPITIRRGRRTIELELTLVED